MKRHVRHEGGKRKKEREKQWTSEKKKEEIKAEDVLKMYFDFSSDSRAPPSHPLSLSPSFPSCLSQSGMRKQGDENEWTVVVVVAVSAFVGMGVEGDTRNMYMIIDARSTRESRAQESQPFSRQRTSTLMHLSFSPSIPIPSLPHYLSLSRSA